jgi:hypothetical protein
MRLFLLSLAFVGAGLAPSLAATFDTPEALLKQLYVPYTSGDNFNWDNWDDAQFRDKHLNDLFAADLKEANGDVGRLDFDPYIDGQDYEIKDLKFGTPQIKGDVATVEVTFTNFGDPDDLTFTLVKEDGGWKIDDVVSKGNEYPYSLKEIMEGPLDTGDND